MYSSSSSSHLLATLTTQIASLQPLRTSYTSLQRYFHKLTADFQTALYGQGEWQGDLRRRVEEIKLVGDDMEKRYRLMLEEVRRLEADKAKITCERNNLISNEQAAKSRLLLETKQTNELKNKHQEIVAMNSKLQLNIQKYNHLLDDLSKAICQKNLQSKELTTELNLLQSHNSKIKHMNDNFEQRLSYIVNENDKLREEVKALDGKIDIYDRLIEERSKVNRQAVEGVIKANEEQETLRHQKQYLSHLLANQLQAAQQLASTTSHINSLLTLKQSELQSLQGQNANLHTSILNQSDSLQSSVNQKNRLKQHLCSLIQTNEMLLKEMERCCGEDKRVKRILDDKVDGLRRVEEGEVLNRVAFKRVDQNCQRWNLAAMSRSREKMGSTWSSLAK